MDINTLVGQTLGAVISDAEEIRFLTEEGREFRLYHDQDCCEQVRVEDINGELADLLDSPILFAEERSEAGEESEWGDSSTWTFYRIGTIKGTVVIRWLGTSNGYYSERVYFEEVK